MVYAFPFHAVAQQAPRFEPAAVHDVQKKGAQDCRTRDFSGRWHLAYTTSIMALILRQSRKALGAWSRSAVVSGLQLQSGLLWPPCRRIDPPTLRDAQGSGSRTFAAQVRAVSAGRSRD